MTARKFADAAGITELWAKVKAYVTNAISNKATKSSIAVTLTVAGWTDYSQTVTATGVTASNDVIITPDPASVEDYVDAGILCTAQSTNSLTFQCGDTPEAAITVNVLILT